MINSEDQKTFISLGNRMFHIEDVESMFIQANHLIINFDYTDKQIVIFFGRNPESYNNAKLVFDTLAEMWGAYKVNLPTDAIPDPNIMETVYKEKVDKAIQSAVKFEKDKFKFRHQRKLNKALNELKKLKEKMK